MASRPNFIDLESHRAESPPHSDLPSPRSGQIPPALSPLDAFALQGRLLAQQLEASRNNGRRISRLPPLTIANELAKPRPGYFTAPPSAGIKKETTSSPLSASADLPGTSPELARPTDRPVSRYPFIQTFDDAESIFTRDSSSTIKQVHDPDTLESPLQSQNPFPFPSTAERPSISAPTTQSSFKTFPAVKEENGDESSIASNNPQPDPLPQSTTANTTLSLSENFRNLQHGGLAVPASQQSARSPGFPRNDMAIRPARSEQGDDSDTLSIPGDRNNDRKLSNSSAFGRPRSPYSPLFAPPRSPSVSSEQSNRFRGSVNFSRPISRAGRPDREGSIQSDTQDTRPSVDAMSLNEPSSDNPRVPTAPWIEGSGTPQSATDDETSSTGSQPNGAPSYIYAKYSLPRGRVLSRNSVLMQDFTTHKFEWEQPRVRQSNINPVDNPSSAGATEAEGAPYRTSHVVMSSIPIAQQSSTSYAAEDSTPIAPTMSMHRSNPSYPPKNPSTLAWHSETLINDENVSQNVNQNVNQNAPGSPRAPTPQGKTSFTRSRTPDAVQTNESIRQMTPEAHLAMGIELHEYGQLQKSTYHLRLAARGGNATAMLIYALACRHGWGMRANQAEGVSWLRRAVDSAGLEVADDEDETQNVEGRPGSAAQTSDVATKRTHRAQLALAIYELGVSYMNGWGIEQDKPLGLRCFEISGTWGDGDALAEAGFCYVKGLGCKKDLKKAADLYRRAEKRGVEMAGNSWIYKEKYMPSPSADEQRKGRGSEKDKEKKPRDKSRTRTIFGGRRKQQQSEEQPPAPTPPPPNAPS